jgi:S1-C subfamily serine protease
MNTFFRSVSRLLIAAAGLTSLAIASPAQTTAAPQSSTVVEREINMETPPTAQAPTPEKAQTRRPGRRPVPPATVTMVADQTRVAPQVVTIVHRLSGVKMLRFLLRQGGEPGIVYQIDPESISSDAHASIIAGWALEDGKTIAVRLPQAGAELEFSRELLMPPPLPGVSPATSGPAFSFPRTEPDLWVITRDGRKLRARYIGLDGETGLSVLQVSPMVQAPVAEEAASMLAQGQSVQIFAPERTAPETGAATRNIYVRVGKIDAKIVELSSSNTDKPPELTVRGYGLSPLFVGGVACDEAGNTLGLVESIDGDNAHIVPADNIRAAARRVLERRASVPKPLLGVVGEPVDLAARAAFLAHGWSEDQFKALLEKHLGILLTTVRPGTPAALAKLHAGDLIVRVNQDDIASGEEFSKSLGKAGSGQLVQFLVRRPGTPDPFAIDVKLGGSFEQVFKYRWEYPELPATRPSGLEGLGVETIAVSTKNLSQIGVETGLLIVAVAPDSVAARGGIREGDVIESIDGRILGRDARGAGLELKPGKRHVLSVIRNREKKQVILEGID